MNSNNNSEPQTSHATSRSFDVVQEQKLLSLRERILSQHQQLESEIQAKVVEDKEYRSLQTQLKDLSDTLDHARKQYLLTRQRRIQLELEILQEKEIQNEIDEKTESARNQLHEIQAEIPNAGAESMQDLMIGHLHRSNLYTHFLKREIRITEETLNRKQEMERIVQEKTIHLRQSRQDSILERERLIAEIENRRTEKGEEDSIAALGQLVRASILKVSSSGKLVLFFQDKIVTLTTGSTVFSLSCACLIRSPYSDLNYEQLFKA